MKDFECFTISLVFFHSSFLMKVLSKDGGTPLGTPRGLIIKCIIEAAVKSRCDRIVGGAKSDMVNHLPSVGCHMTS